ncbi:MAG: hypothetical protein N3B18_11210 [Desulfobacterota bacterium]|nr:hypothetical protein [Thermodesulfobacteriota bacterium]
MPKKTCAHSGIINTLNHITKNLPGQKIHAVIGGTHLEYLDEKQRAETIEHLRSFSIERIGVSPCIGLTAATLLKQAFCNRFFFVNGGGVLTIELP